jgi:hypothetical protein
MQRYIFSWKTTKHPAKKEIAKTNTPTPNSYVRCLHMQRIKRSNIFRFSLQNAGEFLIGVLENKNGYFIQHKA